MAGSVESGAASAPSLYLENESDNGLLVFEMEKQKAYRRNHPLELL